MKFLYRLQASLYIAVLLSSTAFAAVPVNDYLHQALTSSAKSSNTQEVGVSGGHRVFDEVQFRWLRDSGKEAQELRFKAKMPGQIVAEQAMFSVYSQLQVLQSNKQLNDELLSRYHSWLALVVAEQQWMLSLRRLALAEAILNYETQLASTADFSAKAMLKAELAVDRQRAESRRYGADVTQLRQTIDINSLHASIDVSEMLRLAISDSFLAQSFAKEKAKLEQRLAEQSLRREKSRSGLALNLIAAQRESDNVQNDVRYTLGLQLPLGGRSFNEAKQQLALANAQNEAQQQQLWAGEQFDLQIMQLKRLQSQLQDIATQYKSIDKKLNTAMVAKRPSLAFLLKQEQLEYSARELDLQRQAHEQWLELLSDSGHLSELPLRNWLLSAQPEL
ncbi:MAG: hypothetical protein ACSHXK_17045 [Oceanococcus sp.]